MPSPRETLVPVRHRAARWVEFDVHWYRKTYSIGRNVQDPLEDYLREGQALGRSPNVFFEETFYLRRYPDVANAVQQGGFQSGFDHYCRDGLLAYTPHWLFSPAFYRSQSPDDEPPEGEFVNDYDHFLRTGSSDGRMGHPLFDPAFYRASNLQCDNAEDIAACPYAHFIYHIHEQRLEVETSLYFDNAWYYANYPETGRAIAAREYLCALEHYLCNDYPTEFDPLADFSEADYLNLYPDVAEAVTKGTFRNGYMHFLQTGVFELRNPSRAIDLRAYWNHNDAARRAVRSRRVRDAFAHVLTEGRRKGLTHAYSTLALDIPERQTRALFAAQAQNLLPLFGRRPIDFSVSGAPICSAIVVLQNGLHLALQAIASLRQNHRGGVQLILVDPGAVEEVRQIERYVHGARLLRFKDDIGFAAACNVALESAAADVLLYLASDALLAPGVLDAALARLDADAGIGAVGGKIVGSGEILQEAGGIVWRDGSIVRYLHGATPLCPEAGFVRDVDFCSLAFLMVRTTLLHALDGLDVALAPECLAAADLGLRIRQSGFRVVYDPCVMLHRYAVTGSAESLQDEYKGMHNVLLAKHLTALRLHHAASPSAVPFARASDRRHRRVLFIEDTVPLRMLGSGYVRANDIVGIMAALGYHVTVFPMQPTGADPAAIAADFPDTVEILYDRSHNEFRTFLASRPGYYDAIWVSRTPNLDLVRPVLEDPALVPGRTRIILDTEAVLAKREALQAEILGEPEKQPLQDALRREFQNAHCCQDVLAVSEQEAGLLSGIGLPSVRVLGTMRDVAPTPRPWRQRSGLLFLGSLHGTDLPNHDALCWFVDAVLPLIEAELGYETQLTVAGHLSPWVTLERIAENARVVLVGPVPNLAPLYDSHRLMVAPTRFAAGTPYKVYESASYGVPVVATSLLCEALGWADGTELLAAAADDPSGFAAKVVALYRSEALWTQIREAAIARLRRENGRAAYAQTIQSLLPAHDPEHSELAPLATKQHERIT